MQFEPIYIIIMGSIIDCTRFKADPVQQPNQKHLYIHKHSKVKRHINARANDNSGITVGYSRQYSLPRQIVFSLNDEGEPDLNNNNHTIDGKS